MPSDPDKCIVISRCSDGSFIARAAFLPDLCVTSSTLLGVMDAAVAFCHDHFSLLACRRDFALGVPLHAGASLSPLPSGLTFILPDGSSEVRYLPGNE